MWSEILRLIQEWGGDKWCVAGAFNSVMSVSERRGVGDWVREEEALGFQEFVQEAGLIDLPIVGRKHTWYRPDGSPMSRLDRFLLSQGWVSHWPLVSQWAVDRGLSDHCPIVLREKVKSIGVQSRLRCSMGGENFMATLIL